MAQISYAASPPEIIRRLSGSIAPRCVIERGPADREKSALVAQAQAGVAGHDHCLALPPAHRLSPLAKKSRSTFTGEFKARVALAALHGDKTVQEIAAKNKVHPNQVSTWKRQAIDGLSEVFLIVAF